MARCMKCEAEVIAFGTPARCWQAGRHVNGLFCPACLRDCRGSLLYSVRGEGLRALTAQERAAWLASLDALDRAEAEAWLAKEG